MKIKTLNRDIIEEETECRLFIEEFYNVFSSADNFDLNAVKDTYNRVFNDWKNNYKYLTELIMALNWKCQEYYYSNEDYAKVYNELLYKTNDYALENLKYEELQYVYYVIGYMIRQYNTII